MSVTLIIPGKPYGKERPRFGKGRTYTPSKTVSYEEYIRHLYRVTSESQKPYEGPVRVDFMIVHKMPKRLPKERWWPSCTPDIDNVIKLVLDSLNGVAYSDDRNVVQGSWEKRYVVGDEIPRVEVTLTFLRRQGARGRYQRG
jgi:Holliday junction resolvase RusA-like endonuclease